MNAADALRVARAAGIELNLDGGDPVLAAAAPPSPEIIDLLSRQKSAIIALPRPGRDGWSPEDWQVFFALAMLREDTRDWWADVLSRDPGELDEDQEPATADESGLHRFIEREVLPWFEARKKELTNRPLIREQAFGEALDPDKLERLGRYEVHLDRKLERMLGMLLRLKDLRLGTVAS